jgi:hypothetical protein
MTPERELQIEASADRVRARLYVYNSLPFDLKAAFSRIGDIDCSPRASVKLLSKEQLKYDEAYADCETKTIYVPTNFASELGIEFPHNRFTFAHELGHIVLGHRGVRSRATLGRDFRKQAGVPGVGIEESEAYYWAGAYLMPTGIAIECRTLDELALRCGVSREAARIRKENLDRRMRRTRGEVRPIPERTKILIEEVFRVAGTKPNSFKSVQPKKFQKIQATATAEILGCLSIPCEKCGLFELVQEGGCMTCQNCGTSNCT